MTTLNTLNTDIGEILLNSLNAPAHDCKLTLPVVSGKSAYDLAAENGFVGSLEDWLASIKGWQPISSEEYMNLLNNTLKDSLLYTDLTSKIEVMEIKFHDDIKASLAAIQANKIELLDKHNVLVSEVQLTQKQLMDEVELRVASALESKELLEDEVTQRTLAIQEIINAIKFEQVTRVEELSKLNDKITDEARNRLENILQVGTQLEQESADRVKAIEAIYEQLKLDHEKYVKELSDLNDNITSDTQTKLEEILSSNSQLQQAVKERTDALDAEVIAIKQEQVKQLNNIDALNKTIVDNAKNSTDSIINLGTKLETESIERVKQAEQLKKDIQSEQELRISALGEINNSITKESQTRLDELLKLNNTTKTIDEKVDGVFAQVNPKYIGTDKGSIGDSTQKVGVWTEYSARVENDFALGQRIDNLVVNYNNNTASISQLNKVVVDNKNSIASQITAMQSKFDNNTSSFTKELETLSNATSTSTKAVEALDSNFKDYKADVIKTYITKADSEQTLATTIDSLKTDYITPSLDKVTNTYTESIKSYSDALKATTEKVAALDSNYTDLSGKAITATGLDTFITSATATEAITNVINNYKTEFIDPELGNKVSTDTIKDYYNKSSTDGAINNAITVLKTEYIDTVLNTKASTKSVDEVTNTITKIDGKLVAVSNKLEGVYAQTNPEYIGSNAGSIGDTAKRVGVWNEYSARIEGDTALGNRIDSLVSEVGNNSAVISQVNKTLVDKTQSLASQISVIKTEFNGNTAKITKDIESLVDSNKSTNKLIEGISSEFTDYKADVINKYITKADSKDSIVEKLESFKTSYISPLVDDVKKELSSDYTNKIDSQTDAVKTTAKKVEALESNYKDLSGTAVTASKLDEYMTSAKANEAMTNVISKYKTEIIDPVLNNKVSTETIKDYYNKSDADEVVNTAIESFKTGYVDTELGSKASTETLREIENRVVKTEQGLTASSRKLDGVFAQVNPEYIGSNTGSIGSTSKKVGVWTEQSARIEGDIVLGQRIDNLAVAQENNSATITEVNKVLVDKTQSLASQLTAFKAEYAGNTATVTKDIEALVNADKSTAKILEGIQNNFKDYKADITKTCITSADATAALTKGLETFKAEQVIPAIDGKTNALASTYDKLLETEVKDGVTHSKRLDGLESKYTDLSGKAVTAQALDTYMTSAKADEAITNVVSKYKTDIIDPVLKTKVSTETIKDYYNKSDADKAINTALETYQASYIDPQLNAKATTKSVEEIENTVKKTNEGLELTSKKLDGVFAQVNPDSIGDTKGSIGSISKRVGVWSELSARIEGDLVLGQRIDNLVAETKGNTASISQTNKVLVDSTQSLASQVTAINTKFGDNVSKITKDIESLTNADISTNKVIEGLSSQFGDYKADAIKTYITKADSKSALSKALEGFKSEYVDPVNESSNIIKSTIDKVLETYSDEKGTHSKRLDAYESKFTDLSGKVVTADTFNSTLTNATSTEAITNVISKYRTEIIDPVLKTKVSTETIKDYYNKSEAGQAINTALEKYQADIIDPALNEKASSSTVTQIENKINSKDTGLEATARKLDGVFLQVNPAYLGADKGSIGATNKQVGVWTELSGRIEADFAIGQRIDNLNVEVKGNAASIQTLNKVIVDKTQSLAVSVDKLNTNYGDYKTETSKTLESLSSASESQGKAITSITSKYSDLTKGAESTVLSDYYTSTKADKVTAGKIEDFKTDYVDKQLNLKAEAKAFYDLKVSVENKNTGLQAVGEKLDGFILKTTPEYIGSNSGSIGSDTKKLGVWTQYTGMLEKDFATAKRIDNLDIELGKNTAAINTVSKLVVDKTKSLAERTDVLEVQFDGKNPASIKSQVQGLSTANESSTRFLKLLNSKFETATGNTAESSILDGFYTSNQADKAITGKIQEFQSDYVDEKLKLKASAKAFSNLESAVNNTDRGLVATATKLDGVYLQVNPLMLGRNNGSIGDTRVTNSVGAWSEYSARLEDNFAQASKIDTITTTLKGNTATIKTQQESLNGLSAKWSVKMDINGRAIGFGLASDATGDKPRSEFAIVADKFYIADPNTTGKGKLLFQVMNVPEKVGNITIPAGVYMDGAFIRYASIDTAHICDGAIIDAKIYNLDAAKITAGYIAAERIKAESITADKIDTKGLSIKDANGNVILGSGTALNVSNITGLGSFATKNDISAGEIGGLGTLATKNRVSNIEVDGLGTLATISKIDASNITTYIDALAVKNILVGNAQITDANINNLSASKITSGYISADRIEGNSITADKIDVTNLLVGNAQIANGAIKSANIANLEVDSIHIKNQAISQTLFNEATLNSYVIEANTGSRTWQSIPINYIARENVKKDSDSIYYFTYSVLHKLTIYGFETYNASSSNPIKIKFIVDGWVLKEFSYYKNYVELTATFSAVSSTINYNATAYWLIETTNNTQRVYISSYTTEILINKR